MPPRTAFGKYLDPVAVYDAAPRLWDFVILLLIFFYLFKRSMITWRALREQGLGEGLGRLLSSAAGGERKQREADNAIAFLFALVMTISLMRFGKVSMEWAFTAGILPGIAAFIVGIGAYTASLGIFGRQKYIALAVAIFVGMGCFAALRVAAGGDYEWMYVVFWFLALIVITGIIKGVEEKVNPAGSAHSAGSAVETADKRVAELLGELEKLKKGTKDTDKKSKDRVKELEVQISSTEKRKDITRKVTMFQSMLIKCLAAAALLLPMPLAQVEQKLKEQGFDNKVVAATMVRLRAKGAGRPSRARPAAAPKEAPPAPAPGKPPAEAPPAPPSAEVVEVTDADKVLTPAEAAPAVEVLAETHEEIRTNINDFENGARDFENIARMLEEASAKEKALAAADEELHKRAGQVKSDLDALAGKMEKTAKAAALRERVEEIGGKAQRLLEAISGEAQSLVDSLNKQFDVLHADVSIFDDVPPKLREKVNQLKELDKRLWAGEEAARVLIATGQQEPLLEEYERILAEIRGILKMHEEGPETVLGILPGIIELLSRHDKMLGDWKKVMLMIEMDSKDVQSQFEVERKKEEAEAKARSEQEEEARKRLIDMDKMIANVAQLEKFVNRVNEVKFEGSVKEPVAMLDKSDIGVYRDLADESNGIVVGLRSERVRINDIPSKTAAMDKLLQALADFTQGQFSKDLTDLLKALKSAAGMGQERGARLSGPLLAEFQKKNYPPVLEGVRMTLTAIKDELAREKQELERGATPA